MPTEGVEAADGQTQQPTQAPVNALTSLLKDTKNAKSQDFLLLHDLDDISRGSARHISRLGLNGLNSSH